MRPGILASILALAVAIASWTAVERHKQARWLSNYREATDSFERRHYSDSEAQLGAILPQEKQPTSHEAALTFNLLALVYHAQGRMKEAEPPFERAIQIFTRGGHASRMDLAKACNSEGRMYLEEGRLQEAEQRLQQALAVYQKEPGIAGAELASALHNLGLVRIGERRGTEAHSLLEAATQVYEQTLGPNDLNLAQAYLDLALLYRSEHRLKEAQEMDQKALIIQERLFGTDSAAARETRARLSLKPKSVPSVSSDKVEERP